MPADFLAVTKTELDIRMSLTSQQIRHVIQGADLTDTEHLELDPEKTGKQWRLQIGDTNVRFGRFPESMT
jgi:hypothetical protein